MRKPCLEALSAAAAIMLSAGMSGHRAEAVARATPSAADVAAVHAPLVRQAVNVCGSNGCVRVETKRVQHYRPYGTSARHI